MVRANHGPLLTEMDQFWAERSRPISNNVTLSQVGHAVYRRGASYREPSPLGMSMAATRTPMLSRFRQWLTRSVLTPSADADLVERFALHGDEGAFAALVDRHGPMVLGVAQRVVGDSHTAEDVLQATFVMLARRAGALRVPAALPAWLHTTAYRLAVSALRSRKRRQEVETHVQHPACASPLDELSSRELLAILDEELLRLPETLRDYP